MNYQDALKQANNATGDFIDLSGNFPQIVGENGERYPLAEFIHLLDAQVDYAELQKELPGVSIAQISAGVLFLAELMQ